MNANKMCIQYLCSRIFYFKKRPKNLWVRSTLSVDDELHFCGGRIVVMSIFSAAISTQDGVKFVAALSPYGLLSFVLRK